MSILNSFQTSEKKHISKWTELANQRTKVSGTSMGTGNSRNQSLTDFIKYGGRSGGRMVVEWKRRRGYR